MNFEVYCDEANTDALTSTKARSQFLMIGSLWMPAEDRDSFKQDFKALREKHSVWGEVKWSKISPSRKQFYLELVDLFLKSDGLRFRCIAVDRSQVDLQFHENDGELGFYKFYYQLLHHWIRGRNQYRVFCDIKTNRDPSRLSVLAQCLTNANPISVVKDVQSLPSDESVPIQLCDILLGAASSKIGGTLNRGSAKSELVERLELGLGRELVQTPRHVEKFNIFRIRLQGGH